MTKENLKLWIIDNLFTKTLKINARKLNKNEYFYNDNIEYFNLLKQFTPKLINVTDSERIYCILNDIEIHECANPNCTNKTEYITYSYGYRKYCSVQCTNEDRVVVDKITKKKKYSKPKRNLFKEFTITELKNKIKEYGIIEFKKLKSSEKTKYIRYGDPKYNNRDKATETMSIKDENGLSKRKQAGRNLSKTLSKKSKKEKEKHYKKVVESRRASDNDYSVSIRKAQETMRIKDENGLDGYERRKLLNQQKYIDSNINYASQEHYTNKDDLTKEFCEKILVKNNQFLMQEAVEHFGLTLSTMYKIKESFGIDLPNKSYMGKSEHEVFNYIKNIDDNLIKTKRVIYPYELDMYSKDYNFAVEFNGLKWHSFGKNKSSKFNNHLDEPLNKHKHLMKTEMCEELNIQLFHVFENEWYTKQEIWKSVINSKLGINERIYARKCIIKEVDNKTTKMFLDNNHLQGNVNAAINIGLYYNNELVSIMTFIKSRYNKEVEYELLRFCNKLNTSVIGGASKLMSYFIKTYKPNNIISYANRRWSQGNLYEKLGFTFTHNTLPNYFYYKNGDLESRVKYQKHKLKDKLELFDASLTESENMYNNGYRKIYDSGNKVYILNLKEIK